MTKTTANSTRRVRFDRTFALACAVALLFAALVSLGDSFYWSARLDRAALERASVRFDLSGREYSTSNAASAPRTREELETRLQSRGGCFEQVGATARAFEADAESSRAALDALDELETDEIDVGLDAARAFLSELDDAPESDAIPWALDVDKGNPLDSFALVSPEDFARNAIEVLADRAASTSWRAFFLFAALGLFFSPSRALVRPRLFSEIAPFVASKRRASARRFFVPSSAPLRLLDGVRLIV